MQSVLQPQQPAQQSTRGRGRPATNVSGNVDGPPPAPTTRRRGRQIANATIAAAGNISGNRRNAASTQRRNVAARPRAIAPRVTRQGNI